MEPVSAETEFSLLMAQLQSGCPQAAQEVVQRYGGHIRKVVRRRLHRRLRPQFDSLDFLQDVWSSFFRTAPDHTFDDPANLIGYLADLACKKIATAHRQQLGADKRNRFREQSLSRPNDDKRHFEPPVRQPTPSQEAVANEQWEHLMRGLPPEYQHMLELLRQGYTHEEVAQHLGTYTKVIQRLLEKLKPKGGPR